MENYGDLLYPIILRRLLQTREHLSVRQFSFLPGAAPLEAGFETSPIRNLFETQTTGPLHLVIGGGDILRTDRHNLGTPYSRHSRISHQMIRHSIGGAGLFGYLLRRNLPRQDARTFYAKRFRQRWMNYPAVGPFLISPEDLPAGGVVDYISCGIPFAFASEIDRVKRTFEAAQNIYLRDEQSAEKVRNAGVGSAIQVAPDIAVLVSDLFDHEAEARRGRQILSQLGVEDQRPLLCFQSQPYPGFNHQEIIKQLKRYIERARAQVVLLPTGYCHGDHEFLQTLSIQSGGALRYVGVNSIFDIISIIAASDVFVGTSLHGNITAFSFGIPHLFGPLPVAKIEGFLGVTNLPAGLKLRSWREINDKLDMANGLGREFFLSRAHEAKSKVRAVVGPILDHLQ